MEGCRLGTTHVTPHEAQHRKSAVGTRPLLIKVVDTLKRKCSLDARSFHTCVQTAALEEGMASHHFTGEQIGAGQPSGEGTASI